MVEIIIRYLCFHNFTVVSWGNKFAIMVDKNTNEQYCWDWILLKFNLHYQLPSSNSPSYVAIFVLCTDVLSCLFLHHVRSPALTVFDRFDSWSQLLYIGGLTLRRLYSIFSTRCAIFFQFEYHYYSNRCAMPSKNTHTFVFAKTFSVPKIYVMKPRAGEFNWRFGSFRIFYLLLKATYRKSEMADCVG